MPLQQGSYRVAETNGITYTSHAGTPVRLDAFQPEPGIKGTPIGLRPTIIFIHGGAWISGSRSDLIAQARVAASEGFTAFSIDYTLASATITGYPLQVRQVLEAVAWVRHHGSTYGVDQTHIGLLGDSAGATLAADAATEAPTIDPGTEAPTIDPGGAVQAVAGWSGIYRFFGNEDGVSKISVVADGVRDFLGCTDPSVQTCQSNTLAASASVHVSEYSPPMFLATSDKYSPMCEIINPDQTEVMKSALVNAGVPVVLQVVTKCAHASGFTGLVLQPTLDWLYKKLTP